MAGRHANLGGAGGKRSDYNSSGKKQQSKQDARSRSHKSARGEAESAEWPGKADAQAQPESTSN